VLQLRKRKGEGWILSVELMAVGEVRNCRYVAYVGQDTKMHGTWLCMVNT
jgi:hypothetical protein